jgi:hypothetical protein
VRRCQKARVDCIEHVARRRPAKTRGDGQTPNRMRDFDKKFEKLSDVVTKVTPSPALLPALPLVITLPLQVTDACQRLSPPAPITTESISPIPEIPMLTAPGPGADKPSLFWESINDTLSCLGQLDPIIRSISLAHMQTLLETYRHMVDFFPFVTLPKDCSCQDLSQHRPLLMFAVLTVASYESARLQQTLSREFRKTIMVQILTGKKSLDLLQGLLIFLAWHHHYMEAQAVSVPMLLQLCIGIASDLGLEKLSTNVRSPLQRENQRDKEAKRAYLGCYYLAVNMGLIERGKNRCIPYSDTLRSYASDLASVWEQKSDTVLPVLINVCQFLEDVEETFHDRSEQALVVRSQVKRLSEKWDRICLASKLQAIDFSMYAHVVLLSLTNTMQNHWNGFSTQRGYTYTRQPPLSS